MESSQSATNPSDIAAPASVSPLRELKDAQVFARDPEDYTAESTADTIERLRKIVARQRKARNDDAAVTEQLGKIKKANATAARKKAKTLAAANPMDTVI